MSRRSAFDGRPGAPSRQAGPPYTSQDYRQELARVEKNTFRLIILSIIVAAVAVFAIVGLIFQIIQ